MKDTESRESGKDVDWVDDAVNSDKDLPMRRSFSVEDLLDEVEKIGNVSTGENKVEIVVRLWKNGFTVNDEDLRSYTEDENQQFLEAIKRGELPPELENSAEEEELEVNVEDLKEEMYVPRKKSFHPFTGRGYRLGSVAPRIIARSPSIHKEDSAPTVPSVSLNDTEPVTSLQIWLADGRRLVQKFNLSHRISDVRDFVQQSESSGSPFILTTSLPFRELRQPDQSLQEADLSNAVIVQRPLLSPSDGAN
ncbi:UBX domain-containing protein 2A isoform X1 [Brienomyrus brachyistius]|uniref:UBX domain-containing protein 2A isoform X1 n=1 Tax=Brienomyrus brachyistius TaxID=42636 RepID=UPI0020B30C6B|nr:UBX domain-containing protein 2A isoform X1 [Brienomyrus brachyistius]